jgi:hypothetical protein
MIRDDLADALARSDRLRTLALKTLLRNFVLQHPRCDERHSQALGCPCRREGDAGSP